MDSSEEKENIQIPKPEPISYFRAELYMRSFGVKIVRKEPIPDSENVRVLDSTNKWSIIYVSQGKIKDWDFCTD